MAALCGNSPRRRWTGLAWWIRAKISVRVRIIIIASERYSRFSNNCKVRPNM